MAIDANLSANWSTKGKVMLGSNDGPGARNQASNRKRCAQEAFVNQCVHFNISFMCQSGFDYELKLLNGVSRRGCGLTLVMWLALSQSLVYTGYI
jgi:hypothetical protein